MKVSSGRSSVLITTTATLGLCLSVTRPQQQQVPMQEHLCLDSSPPSSSSSVTAIAQPCDGYSLPSVACIHRYGSVLQAPFERKVRSILAHADTYPETEAPNDPSFIHVQKADFLIFDTSLATDLLGSHPQSEYMFDIERVSHEAPIYIPTTHELFFSRLQHNYISQLYVNLSSTPPSLTEKTANPPIYAATGARFKNGLLYLATVGGSSSPIQGHTYRPGLYTLDPRTQQSTTLLNNYYGYYFNAADDLDIDANDNIYFTDNDYGRPVHVNDYPPQLNPATYLYNLQTGQVRLIEDSLVEPNGVQLSADGTKLFLTDTGAGEVIIDPDLPASDVPHIKYNATGKRTIYSYDIERSLPPSSSLRLGHKTPVHLAMDYAPDGIKVSREGHIVTASGHGVTVLSEFGDMLMRIQMNFTVINIAWAGPDSEELWAVGVGGVQRVRMGIKGPLPLK